MICFFGDPNSIIYVVQKELPLNENDNNKLTWLFGDKKFLRNSFIQKELIGPKSNMVTPWSTNAVEICHNIGVKDIIRIEMFWNINFMNYYDPMIHFKYNEIGQQIFDKKNKPEPIKLIDDIAKYNKSDGLSLSNDEILYLKNLSKKLKRKLTDSEVFGFSQVNSEHCRHKIFNGKFIIDNKPKKQSLFELIKKTSKKNGENLISAYKDNVAFIKGPKIVQFAPKNPTKSSYYIKKSFKSVLSLKAETHNFPTTVEPFSGAATGSGGEIRDRLAGGQGSIPIAGTAVYMTSYPRNEPGKKWEKIKPRKWLYQNPKDILIKASNGASDFGNKFGQPLICGSILTFEYFKKNKFFAFDKVIMLAGGVGYTKENQSQKKIPKKGDKIIILGGDNYRIGMGGAAVSSTDTGTNNSGIELNAVQRSNPEMQKRVANTIRSAVELDYNPIISIHDHGAGGHLNCISELIENVGGKILIDKLPIGDKSLSFKEIMGNESQERMGVITDEKGFNLLKKIAKRERAPIYEVGEVSCDNDFKVYSETKNSYSIDLKLSDFFGNTPKTIVEDKTTNLTFEPILKFTGSFEKTVSLVLQLESVACKDWLTNKVDRCVTGRVFQQQCVGPHQLPLANCGVVGLDYEQFEGIVTSIGHAPISGLINPSLGSKNSIAKALTNIIWAPIKNGLCSISLSANWMWPCNNPGEDARLYQAVKSCSKFAIELGINIPTGKDSLSMKQKYIDKDVLCPGTVIISATANCCDVKKVVKPVLKKKGGDIYLIDLSDSKNNLGGSAYAQIKGKIGNKAPDVVEAKYFKKVFKHIQNEIFNNNISAGHDIGSGGLITSLLELCFSSDLGIDLRFNKSQKNIEEMLLSEQVGLIIQIHKNVYQKLLNRGIKIKKLGKLNNSKRLNINQGEKNINFEIDKLRKIWFKSSYLFDINQSGKIKAKERFDFFDKTPLKFKFPENFENFLNNIPRKKIKAAVLREKGSNSEREMAFMLHLAGFEVKDVHMTDITSGIEDLKEIKFLVAVGGFSNSDVLGSAKGWAGTIKYNPTAKKIINDFFKRDDTLSLGVCNGCQLFMELELLYPEHSTHPKMDLNDSGKFECIFTDVKIEKSNSIILKSLEGSRLGIWSAHGEGKFTFPLNENKYQIGAKYSYSSYPSNPNGSNFDTAMLCSNDGRHLVMMPHLERSIFPGNWGYYPENRNDRISPWILSFIDAYKWLSN